MPVKPYAQIFIIVEIACGSEFDETVNLMSALGVRNGFPIQTIWNDRKLCVWPGDTPEMARRYLEKIYGENWAIEETTHEK